MGEADRFSSMVIVLLFSGIVVVVVAGCGGRQEDSILLLDMEAGGFNFVSPSIQCQQLGRNIQGLSYLLVWFSL